MAATVLLAASGLGYFRRRDGTGFITEVGTNVGEHIRNLLVGEKGAGASSLGLPASRQS